MDPEPQRQPGAPDVESPAFDLADLQRQPRRELVLRAEQAGIEDACDLDTRALVFRLQTHLAGASVGRGRGLLELRPEGFGFLRVEAFGCEPGADDIYVGANQIRRLRLRQGQRIAGIVRPPRNGENYFALLRVESIEGETVQDRSKRTPFPYLKTIVPHRPLPLGADGTTSLRAIDLLAPLAYGQRVLLRGAPTTELITLSAEIAETLTRRDVTLLVVSIDQAPEAHASLQAAIGDATDTQWFATDMDAPPARHVECLSLVRARVERLVEAGRHVVVLLNSLNHAVRAFNATVPHSGAIASAGLDGAALIPAKELLCLARQVDGGGSATVIATLPDPHGSHLDAAIATEFAGRASVQLTLDPALGADPALPPLRCSASAAEWPAHYLSAPHLRALQQWRSCLPRDDGEALAALARDLRATNDNDELLAADRNS